MDPTPNETKPRSRRGQTLAEFALTLPILLMLMFGVIEFARIFQAWITLQNAARTAARYAITGQWDENDLSTVLGVPLTGATKEEKRNNILDALVPCTTGIDVAFQRHWGIDCEPGNDEHQGLRADMARLPSIAKRAHIGAAGLSAAEGDHIKGLHKADGTEINTQTSVGPTDPRAFHVWMCSSRPWIVPDPKNPRLQRYYPDPTTDDRNRRLCPVVETGSTKGANQYDAGGPGDAVEIIIFFNHPLITPLGLTSHIELQARRVMINESFRSTRLVNLPPALAQPTLTPSLTPLPSNTPLPSETPLPTFTPTRTPTALPTETTTPTPTPDCTLVTLDGATLTDRYLQIRVRNANTVAPVFITRAEVNWSKHALYPGMYADEMSIVGRSAFWKGPDYAPNTVVDGTDPGWKDDAPTYYIRKFDAAEVTTWQILFTNGPAMLSNYFTLGNFAGTTLYFGTQWGGVNTNCQVTLVGYPTPTPPSVTPTRTPTPVCADYVVSFMGFETNGVVRFRVRNTGTAIANLTGFTIAWNTYNRSLPPISLDFVSVGGTSAFDPVAVKVWDGNDNSSPATATSGGAGWIVNAAIDPGQTANIWLDFDGTAGRLDSGSMGYRQDDFNDTNFVFNYICNAAPPDQPTPAPTQPPTVTQTPTITLTPSKTRTPGPTNTRTPITPSKTPSKTNTPKPATATKTRTPVPTSTQFGGEN